MKITVLTAGGSRRIGVLGHLDSAAERAELQGLIDPAAFPGPVHVDFYDADVLPPEVLAALARRLDAGAPLKLVAYHGLLVHSLIRLGLPAQQVATERQHAPLNGCQALALAGSANSLEKILEIVSHLPVAQVAVFVAQHVAEDQVNLLDQLLRVRTEYRVLMPQHLVPVVPGTLYVAPPGHHMKVAHGLVYLTRDPKIMYARPSIDALFESLAGEYGPRVVVALLCGFGADGVDGCAALRKAGACVIVEDPEDCQDARILPEGARQAGHFDHILKLPAITSLAAVAVQGEQGQPAGPLLELFLEGLWGQYGYDFRGYQRDSLERRLRNLISQFGLADFCGLQRAVFSDPVLFQRMVAELTVGVTEFFRHPEQFRALRQEVLPYLDSFPVIKVWSAGCATGEEPYSLAMLLEEMGLLAKTRLFATDLNHYLLDLAKSALYPLSVLPVSRSNYLLGGGSGAFDDFVDLLPRFLAVKGHLAKAPLIHQHSLVDGGVFNEFQLILCRYVMIYFDEATQRRILQRFARSMHPNGFLMLGPKDGLLHVARSEGFMPMAPDSHIYRFQERASQ